MTITQMRYYAAVCTAMSFTEAARQLYVSQPSISAAMKEIEKQAGRPLFYKQGSRISLTEAGKVLFEEVTRVLEQIDYLEDLMRSDLLDRQYVRLGFSTLVGNTAAPRICAAFRSSYPGIRIISEEEKGMKLLSDLSEEKLDIVITGTVYGEDEKRKDAFGSYELTSSRMVFCVSRSHPLAGKQQITLEEIAEEPLIMPGERFPVASVILKSFEKRGLHPNILLTTSQIFTIDRFVMLEAAAGFLPEEYAVSRSEIRILHCPEIEQNNPSVSLYWNRHSLMYPPVRDFISCAKQIYPGH